MLINSLRSGFFSVRQNSDLMGRAFTLTIGFLCWPFLRAPGTPAAASAVAHPALICRSPKIDGLMEGLVVRLRLTALPRSC